MKKKNKKKRKKKIKLLVITWRPGHRPMSCLPPLPRLVIPQIQALESAPSDISLPRELFGYPFCFCSSGTLLRASLRA